MRQSNISQGKNSRNVEINVVQRNKPVYKDLMDDLNDENDSEN